MSVKNASLVVAATMLMLLTGCAESEADYTRSTLFDSDSSSYEAPVGGGYNAPVPAVGGDLDCSDMNGPVAISGSDPHGLDADNDGIGCE